MRMNRTIRFALALLATLFAVGSQSVTAVQFSSVDIDLDIPDANNDINVFDTIVSVTPQAFSVTISTDPIQVDYVDPNQRGMQVDLDVDFSDPNNPVVNTIEFVGQAGDLEHQFPGGAVNVDLGIFGSFDVVPAGIRGFIKSNSGPINVNPDGTFEGGSNSLVARQGTIDVFQAGTNNPVIDQVDLMNTPIEAFVDPISNGSTNTVVITKSGSSGDTFFYNVDVLADLDGTSLDFVANEADVNLNITGKLIGTGQIQFTIPEPTTLSLCGLAAIAALSRRRKL